MRPFTTFNILARDRNSSVNMSGSVQRDEFANSIIFCVHTIELIVGTRASNML